MKNKILNENTISLGLSTCILVIYYTYIQHLEKSECICSLDWRQRFIKKYILIMLIISISSIILIIFVKTNNNIVTKYKTQIGLIYTILYIVYYVILGQWLWKLHKSKCICSDDWRKTMIQVIYIISLILYISFILNIISKLFKIK